VQEWVYAYKITSADELKQCIADERDKMGQQWHKRLFPHEVDTYSTLFKMINS